MNPNVRNVSEEILSDNWYVLRKIAFEYRNQEGNWESQSREAYDRGNGATILLYSPEKQTVILTRQFRMPTYLNGNESGILIEACAGLLDRDSPEEAIIRETEEETGYRVTRVRKIGETYMSPGSVTELLHFFVAEYSSEWKVDEGGGLAEENENIEVLELDFQEALRMIEDGRIKDAKTILLLRHAQVNGLLGKPAPSASHILIAGPYRSGTGDDPHLIERNVRAMNAIALQVYELGHLPVLGEWYALPLIETAGSARLGDELFDRYFHPSSIRLLDRIDAVLRIGGASEGADRMVSEAKRLGKEIYYELAEIQAVDSSKGGVVA